MTKYENFAAAGELDTKAGIIQIDALQFENTWVGKEPNKERVIVAPLWLVREQNGITTGMNRGQFDAFMAGHLILSDLETIPEATVEITYASAEEKLPWQSVADDTLQYSWAILLGHAFPDNSIDPNVLMFNNAEWDAFLGGVMLGEFDIDDQGKLPPPPPGTTPANPSPATYTPSPGVRITYPRQS